MKYFFIAASFATLTAFAQNFSPAQGASTASPGTGTVISPATAGAGSFGSVTAPSSTPQVPSVNDQTLNQTNTAPTSVPSDTSLINNESNVNDSFQQSQQERLDFSTRPSDAGTNITPTGTGTGLTSP